MENFPPNFVDGFLRLHNQYRGTHDAPPLSIDEKLNDYAQERANALAENGVLEDEAEAEYGENIFISTWKSTDRDLKPLDPLESWYREGRFFKYGQEQPKSVTDVCHFTQLIWKGSNTIGLGIAIGSDEKIYFVCNYNPRGNVEGEFAENVLPMKEVEQQLSPRDAEGILFVKTRPEAAKSMERLYAVPSEELRVWLVWLTKVSDLADEWQRWLRAHIDFVVRLSDLLCEAELTIIQTEMVTVQPENLAISEKQVVEVEETEMQVEKVDSDRGDPEGSLYEEATDTTLVEETVEATEEADNVDEASEASKVASPEESKVTITESQVTVKAASIQETTTVSKTSVKEESETTLTPGDNAEVQPTNICVWPVGIPWEHLGLEDVCDKEEFEKLPLPSNEQEMREFLKKFTHEATVYRSYYKHWEETSEQAIKEMGGRLVMATFLVQGKDRTGQIKKPPPCPKPCGSKAGRKTRTTSFAKESEKSKDEKADTSASKTETAAEPAEEAAPEEAAEPAPEEAAEPADEAAAEPDAEAAAEPDAEAAAEPADEAAAKPAAKPASSRKSRQGKRSRSNIRKRSQSKARRKSKKAEEVPDWVRDCARALEPIPYVFYVTAEPDIDIAIEHDDEEVILADLDRESIVAERKRVFYNLADKPCKGGKPWI